jgi:hypothetical protein
MVSPFARPFDSFTAIHLRDDSENIIRFTQFSSVQLPRKEFDVAWAAALKGSLAFSFHPLLLSCAAHQREFDMAWAAALEMSG